MYTWQTGTNNRASQDVFCAANMLDANCCQGGLVGPSSCHMIAAKAATQPGLSLVHNARLAIDEFRQPLHASVHAVRR